MKRTAVSLAMHGGLGEPEIGPEKAETDLKTGLELKWLAEADIYLY